MDSNKSIQNQKTPPIRYGDLDIFKNHLVSLDLAKQLHKAGFVRTSTFFYNPWYSAKGLEYYDISTSEDIGTIPAFTAGELFINIPFVGFSIIKENDKYVVNTNFGSFEDVHPVNAFAKLILYLMQKDESEEKRNER